VGFGSVGAAPVEGEDGNMDSAEVVVGVQYIYQGVELRRDGDG